MENIQQILTEHEVLEREPEAAEQNLDVVLFTIGNQRARVQIRPSRLDDGVFASWAICLPMFPQPESYSRLMRARRSEWFGGVPSDTAADRARYFFSARLLDSDLGQLARLVTAEDAADRIEIYLGAL